jgi:hypothetical protein
MNASMAEPVPASEPEPAGYSGRIDGGSIASRIYAKLATRAGAATAALLLMMSGFSAGYFTGAETAPGAKPEVRSAALPNAPREMQPRDARTLPAASHIEAPAANFESPRLNSPSAASDVASSTAQREPRITRRAATRSQAASTPLHTSGTATTPVDAATNSGTNPTPSVTTAPSNGLENVRTDQQNDPTVSVNVKIQKHSKTEGSKTDKP